VSWCASRATIREALLRALTRLRDAYPHAQLQFTRPFEDIVAPVAGAMPVEYPWIAEAAFAAALPDAPKTQIAIGRTGPPELGDDHPNDPAFYRRLMDDGYRVVVPATSFLRRAFRDDPSGVRPELVEGGALAGRPDLPDVMLFRGRPGRRGDADARILAAMAAARPVIVFAQALGAREWIEQGRTGFVVESRGRGPRPHQMLLANDAALAARTSAWPPASALPPCCRRSAFGRVRSTSASA
jgi:glycosyltransferase involved in cell wall biosynthesis